MWFKVVVDIVKIIPLVAQGIEAIADAWAKYKKDRAERQAAELKAKREIILARIENAKTDLERAELLRQLRDLDRV